MFPDPPVFPAAGSRRRQTALREVLAHPVVDAVEVIARVRRRGVVPPHGGSFSRVKPAMLCYGRHIGSSEATGFFRRAGRRRGGGNSGGGRERERGPAWSTVSRYWVASGAAKTF